MKYLLLIFFSLSISFAKAGTCDSLCHHQLDSIVKINQGLRTKLFLADYKIEKVKFYLDLVDKKPSQLKFLRGWIRRAIN